MLGRAARAVLATSLVVVMAGSAVAFALGVNFAPAASCTPSGYGSSCPTKKYDLHHIRIKGFDQIRNCHGHVHVTLINHNQVPSQVKLVLQIKTRSGKILRITKTFTLGVGKKITIDNRLKGFNILFAELKLTVTDANGDVTTITTSTKGKPVACVKGVSAIRPTFTG